MCPRSCLQSCSVSFRLLQMGPQAGLEPASPRRLRRVGRCALAESNCLGKACLQFHHCGKSGSIVVTSPGDHGFSRMPFPYTSVDRLTRERFPVHVGTASSPLRSRCRRAPAPCRRLLTMTQGSSSAAAAPACRQRSPVRPNGNHFAQCSMASAFAAPKSAAKKPTRSASSFSSFIAAPPT